MMSKITMAILICLCTSQTSVSALNAASLYMKRSQNFTNEIQHGPNKLGASIISLAPRNKDTLVVLAGQDAQLSFTEFFVNLSKCENKEIAYYTRKPPRYHQKVLLATEAASFSSPTVDPEAFAYIGRVSVRITGENSRVLIISNVGVDDTNTYGIEVRCSFSHTNLHQEEVALVVKLVAKGNSSLSGPVFIRQPQDIWIKKRAVFHCKAKFAEWLFLRCENILGLKFKVTAGQSNTTLAAKMRIYRGQLMGEHTEATCYCQAIGRGAVIQHSRLARIRLIEAARYWWSPWSDWEPCSSLCGNGTQLSRRRCSNHERKSAVFGRKSSFKMVCEQIRSQPCWSQCPGSVTLTCPDEISVFNLTAKELFHKSWSIAPNFSQNSSDVEFTMTVTHSALNFSTSLEIQLHTFSLPDIVLKGEWNGSGIKYSKGNVTAANKRENPRAEVPIICTVPTSSKPYSITFSVRNNFRQRAACNFYATVHGRTQAPSKAKHQEDSNSVSVTVLIGVVALSVCVVIGMAIVARYSRLRKRSRLPSTRRWPSAESIHDCQEVHMPTIEPIYHCENLEPCFEVYLPPTVQRKHGRRHAQQLRESLETETCDRSVATTSTNVRTSQENFWYPCSSHARPEDHHSSCVNLSAIRETAKEGVFIHDGTLSESSALNNSICSAPLSPRTRNKSFHSQKSAVSFGPSEISCITFNPSTDLPPSADPRYCDYGLVDYRGGRLTIKNTGVSLYIPMFAVPEGESELIYIALQRVEGDQPPLEDKEAMLSPIVICGPDGMQFQKSVFLTMPHCADMTDDSSWNMEVKSSQDASRVKSGWETRASSTDGDWSDAFFQMESKECTLIIDHFTKFCLVGRPQNAQGNSNNQSTEIKGTEKPDGGATSIEGATGGKEVEKLAEEPKGDESDRERRKLRRIPVEEQKKEGLAFRLVAIVAYSSPPCVDKDCAVRVYCIPNLEASFQRLDDLERDKYQGEISDAGHKVLKFEGSGENLKIKDIGEFKGWELSQGSRLEEEILFDIIWKGLEDSLPPNVRFLYRRVDTDVYHFKREYKARQDKSGAKAVRFHANSSIKRQNPSSSGYCSSKPAESIRLQIPLAVRKQLCYRLDPKEFVISDWRDLAAKLGCDGEYIRWLERGQAPGTSPTYELFDLLESKDISLGRLKQILRKLGRDDCVKVIDDYQNTEV